MRTAMYMRVGNPDQVLARHSEGGLQSFQLDNNSPSILPRLSSNQPYSQRSYAGFSDLHLKKVKKVCDNNLTYAGCGWRQSQGARGNG